LLKYGWTLAFVPWWLALVVNFYDLTTHNTTTRQGVDWPGGLTEDISGRRPGLIFIQFMAWLTIKTLFFWLNLLGMPNIVAAYVRHDKKSMYTQRNVRNLLKIVQYYFTYCYIKRIEGFEEMHYENTIMLYFIFDSHE